MKGKYSLLLVDDETANLQKLQRTFMDQYSVFLAQSGEEAVEFRRCRI
jgi:response regulator RpfG family c-di-GMP phosphodiesterase